jgi:hypothetical protein
VIWKGSPPPITEEHEVLLTIMPPLGCVDLKSSGRKARVTVRTDHTFRSKSFLPLSMSMSRMGIEYPAPALLRSTSREPLVREDTLATAAVMDSSERVSSWMVSMPAAVTFLSLTRLRAEANTRQPALWKARASPEPRLPSEHPVMRTVRFGSVILRSGDVLWLRTLL